VDFFFIFLLPIATPTAGRDRRWMALPISRDVAQICVSLTRSTSNRRKSGEQVKHVMLINLDSSTQGNKHNKNKRENESNHGPRSLNFDVFFFFSDAGAYKNPATFKRKWKQTNSRESRWGDIRQQAQSPWLSCLVGSSDVPGFDWKVQKAIKNDGGGPSSYPSTQYGTLSTHDCLKMVS